ncbi:BTAD domain-containing putative transcriptional regulator [Aestuariivirga sp.]|uniref:BTAD domain-containing putative transcriptional regulator n=1 Tax=Aestuariivirga sp. TaxID=2650926 RepID=UPI00391DDEF1
MTRLVLKLLGDFAATNETGDTREVSSRKGRCLIAFLVMSPRGVTRERLASLLWSESADPQARSSLRQTLAVLRKEIREGVLIGDDERVALQDVESDVQEFERLAASGSADDLRAAVKLWRGDFLADAGISDPSFSEWLESTRSRLAELFQNVISRLLPLEAGAARVALAQRLVSLDPFRETSHLALMQAHAEAGERAQALAAYREVRDLLERELGVAPGRAIEEFRAGLMSQEKGRASSTAGSAVKPSVLVLPFANLSGDPSRQYLSEGITEDLISLLGRYSEVNVVTRNALSLQVSSADGEKVARSLGADFLVKGAARAAPTGLVVSCQLVEGSSGKVVWSERYERQAADIFAVVDEVAVRIVTALGSRLVSSGASLAGRKPTEIWSAYDYFLKGRELCNAGKEWEAEAFFSKAVGLDARFALAHAWRALSLLGQFWRQGDMQCLDDARASAEEALRQDANEPMSHYAAGTVFNYLLQYERSEDHFRRAIALNPLDVNIRGDYASLLLCQGRYAEALETVDAVLARDPYPPTWMRFVRGKVLFFMGDFVASIRALESAHWNYRSHVYLAAAQAHLGHIEQARRHVEAMHAIHPTVTAREIRITSGIVDPGMLATLIAGLHLGGFRA